MEIYGLIGKKLSHSFSADYFSKKFERQQIEAKYKLLEIDQWTTAIGIDL